MTKKNPEDYCSICDKELHGLKLDPCYDCQFGDPLFWCYKHEHFSFDRVKCPSCLAEKKALERKGMPIGL